MNYEKNIFNIEKESYQGILPNMKLTAIDAISKPGCFVSYNEYLSAIQELKNNHTLGYNKLSEKKWLEAHNIQWLAVTNSKNFGWPTNIEGNDLQEEYLNDDYEYNS